MIPTATSQPPTQRSERLALGLVLLITFCQGLLYLLLLPPWQHYDEPTHYEYVRLLVDLNRRPVSADINAELRRELAASMMQHHFYDASHPAFSLLSERGEAMFVGVTELAHPPAYYLLAGLPLRLISHADVATQLYVLRGFSLFLLLLTVLVAAGIARDLTPPGHPLRWLVPLVLALLPPFVDVMTAVNNDGAAVLCVSLFLWAALRTILFGPSWLRSAAMLAAALLGVLTKTTAALALPLLPLALLLGFWLQRGWRWRWLVGTTLLALVALLLAVGEWGDAAYWYRDAGLPTQTLPTQASRPEAPFGGKVLQIEANPGIAARRLINPLLPADNLRAAGQTLSFGAWMWASAPTELAVMGVTWQVPANPQPQSAIRTVSLSTTPTFVMLNANIPAEAQSLAFVVGSRPFKTGQRFRIFLDGAILTPGAYLRRWQPPVFTSPDGRSGTWGEKPFENLLRGSSAEQSWPRLRPWIDQVLSQYTRRAMAQIPASVVDSERVGPTLLRSAVELTFDGLVRSYAWGHVRLESDWWVYLARGMALVALIGGMFWLVRAPASGKLRTALLFLGLVGALVWLNTVLRPLPLLDRFTLPATRYTFPAIIPTVLLLAGGWLALWPRHARRYAALGLAAGLLLLNLAAVQTIWGYYQAVALAR